MNDTNTAYLNKPGIAETVLANIRQHPRGFWYIFFGEFAERSSYYGVLAILASYLKDVIRFDEGAGGMIVHAFKALCYLLPLVGGWIADRWLGKFWTIVLFSVPYIIGHVVLGHFPTNTGLLAALILLAIGTGAIKPNVAPLMQLMYDELKKPEKVRHQAVDWYYGAINLGSGLSMPLTPVIRSHYGYEAAFMLPAVLMVLAMIAFYLGKKHYPQAETTFGGLAKNGTPASNKASDRQVLLRIAGVFGLMIPFWSIYDQTNSTWVYFARNHMNSYGLDPELVQAFNPWIIMALTPFTASLWVLSGIKASTKKMLIGYGITALCMAVMAVAGYSSMTGRVSILWEFVSCGVITIAELCVSTVGLAMAYDYAPYHMKSRVQAAFLLTTFGGNLLAMPLAKLYSVMQAGNYFALLSVMMVAIMIVHYFVGRRFEQVQNELSILSVQNIAAMMEENKI